MRWLLLTSVALLQVACASQDVRCGGRLRPINVETASGALALPAVERSAR
jgi:hypothetical protein